jgi:hypothetical protein
MKRFFCTGFHDAIMLNELAPKTFTLPEAESRVTVIGQFSQPAGMIWETQ